jgi:hypothetical protein
MPLSDYRDERITPVNGIFNIPIETPSGRLLGKLYDTT